MHMWLQFFLSLQFWCVVAIFSWEFIESCNFQSESLSLWPIIWMPIECQFYLWSVAFSWIHMTNWNCAALPQNKPSQVNTFNYSILITMHFITIHFLLHLHGCSAAKAFISIGDDHVCQQYLRLVLCVCIVLTSINWLTDIFTRWFCSMETNANRWLASAI